MENIVIRHANEGDIERIVEIAASQWSKIYEGYRELLGEDIYPLWFLSQLERKREVIREVARDGAHCLVAEIEGIAVGFASFKIETVDGNTLGILGNNAVDGDYRGRGIGGMLYKRIFAIMKEMGCVGVKVTTGLDDKHAPARRAYEKMGFEKNLPSVTYYKKL